jgi:phage-related tail fiber protein
MAFDFPSSPSVGQVYAPVGGPSYLWTGVAWLVQGTAYAQQPCKRDEFFTTTAPAGWLKANGAAVSLTAYPRLLGIYCGDALNATASWGYRCTNPANPTGTRSTTGGYIVLPDCRGNFSRGLDDGRGVDASRSLWTDQADAFQGHAHNVNGTIGSGTGIPPGSPGNIGTVTINTTNPISYSGYGTVRVATETRPLNNAALVCISY